MNRLEKIFLNKALVKLAEIITKEKKWAKITEKEEKFFNTVIQAYDACEATGIIFPRFRSQCEKKDLQQLAASGVELLKFPEKTEHSQEILKVCMEFSYIFYSQNKPCSPIDFFEGLCDVFDLFPVSRMDYKIIIDKTTVQAEEKGVDSFLEKYENIICEKEMADGCFNIDVPEIIIPAHKKKFDLSDDDDLKEWEEIEEHLDELYYLCDDEIAKQIKNLTESVSLQLDKAQEKYDELKELYSDEDED